MPQHIQGFGGVLKLHMCDVKREIGGPNRPHDAHDAGSWGACRALKMRYKPQQNDQNTRCGQCLWL